MYTVSTFALTLSISSILLITGQRIEYLNGLYEDQQCPLESGSYGRCRKISDCLTDFEIHRRDKTVLKVCSFSSNPQSHLICCSQNVNENEQIYDSEQTTKSQPIIRPAVTTTTLVPTTTTTPAWSTTTDQTTTTTERTTTRPVQTTTTTERTTARPVRTTTRRTTTRPATTTTTTTTDRIIANIRSTTRPIWLATEEQTTTKRIRTTTRIRKTTSTSTTEPTLNFRGEEDDNREGQGQDQDGIKYDPYQTTTEQMEEEFDLIDFESCRDGLLKYRNQWINTNNFGNALADKVIPLNNENCDLLNQWNLESGTTTQNFYSCRPARGRYFLINNSKRQPEKPKVREGFRPNMAAIGCILNNGKTSYRCYGSIVTEKFIVTAAHCRDLEDLPPPTTVRVGDRYLTSLQDDENAQQLKILEFIVHPKYTPTLDYNDIAMIETAERIIFNNFVVPACIGGVNDVKVNDSTVSGYADDADGNLMNTLMEMDVEIIPNSECNKFYGKDQQLPSGIVNSQICVRGKATRKDINDTCFGESGSPLQFSSTHDINDENYESEYILTTYETSTLIGIQSFSTSCALDIPSVYTRLDFYRDWIRSVIEFIE
ncbi:serine protease Hayan-like [Chironomus tepperi]|uniref:serine protease Hayan-like n=1 Tax=Chironomus tepperi TaxID=113505 RepID=UPI00391FB39E